MVTNVNIVDAASRLAMNDLKNHFVVNADQSPEDVRGLHNDLTAIEYYNYRYDYYFDILLENSEQ